MDQKRLDQYQRWAEAYRGLPLEHQRPHVAAIIELLDACIEAHQLIWTMSQDQEAYQRGKEEGRREAAEVCLQVLEELDGKLRSGKLLQRRGETEAAAEMAGRIARRIDDLGPLAPPNPPEVMRREIGMLRGLLGEVSLCMARSTDRLGVNLDPLFALYQRIHDAATYDGSPERGENVNLNP